MQNFANQGCDTIFPVFNNDTFDFDTGGLNFGVKNLKSRYFFDSDFPKMTPNEKTETPKRLFC